MRAGVSIGRTQPCAADALAVDRQDAERAGLYALTIGHVPPEDGRTVIDRGSSTVHLDGLVSAFAVRGAAALTEPATYDARVRVVSSTATSTTLAALSWRAL